MEIFAKKGYHAASVDEIAEKSQISKGGIYFYFPSKEDLFISLIKEFGRNVVDRIKKYSEKGTSGKEKLERAFDKTLDIFTRYSALARFLLIEACGSNPKFEAERQIIFDQLEEVIADYINEHYREQGEKEKLDSRLIAALWIGGVYHLIITELVRGNLSEIYEKREIIKNLLINNFLKEGKDE